MTLAQHGYRKTFAAAIVGLGLASAMGPAAHAQQFMVMSSSTSSPMGSSEGRRVSSRSIDSYSRLLGLDQDQTEIARELHQQYMLELGEANQERRSSMQGLMAEYQETEDREILQKRMPELATRLNNQLKAIEAALFGDLRLLLDEEQAGRWESVERLRRRETTLKTGGMSGETVDLLSVTESVFGEDAMNTEVIEALGQYEMELDRALVNKARVQEEMKDSMLGVAMTFDMSSMEEMNTKTREVGVRIRDVNRRYARVIESLLPEDLAGTFRDETKRRTFPQVFRESRVERLLAAALKMDDLEPAQRTTIDEISASYARERGAADARWASAISKEDEEGGSSLMAGGMVIRMRMMDGSEDESPVGQARSDRRAVDERFTDRLKAVLNEDQRDRLPKPEENQHIRGSSFMNFGSGGIEMVVPHSGGGH